MTMYIEQNEFDDIVGTEPGDMDKYLALPLEERMLILEAYKELYSQENFSRGWVISMVRTRLRENRMDWPFTTHLVRQYLALVEYRKEFGHER